MKMYSFTASNFLVSYKELIELVMDHGRFYKVASGPRKGTTRKEIDFLVLRIKKPWEHTSEFCKVTEVEEQYVRTYIEWIADRGKQPYFCLKDAVFDNRLLKQVDIVKAEALETLEGLSIDMTPIGLLIDMYKLHGSETNRACIEIANQRDIAVNPSPCFRVVDTKVTDGELSLITYARSSDLIKEFPTDVMVINALKDYIALEIGALKSGELLILSKGVHIYEHDFERAKEILKEYEKNGERS